MPLTKYIVTVFDNNKPVAGYESASYLKAKYQCDYFKTLYPNAFVHLRPKYLFD